MSLQTALVAALEEVDGLSRHVFPLEALKNARPPFVLYLQAGEDEEQALDGATGLRNARFELSCVHASYAGLCGLCAAVKARLSRLQGADTGGVLFERVACAQASPDLYESDVNLFRRIYDLQLNYQEGNEHE